MRYVLIGAGSLLAAWAATVQPGSAQQSPWGPRAWCTQGPIGSMMFPDCSFYTYDQCRATASGLGLGCIANPYYVEPRRAPVRRKVRRHRR
jgi:hypothetical protein